MLGNITHPPGNVNLLLNVIFVVDTPTITNFPIIAKNSQNILEYPNWVKFSIQDIFYAPYIDQWLQRTCFCTFPFQTFATKYFVLYIIAAVLAVRLAGGSYSTGRVEVYYNGTWGTVCDDGWNINNARVVCRQLGFRYALNAYRSVHYSQGTGPILLDDVSCEGSELSLFSCNHRGVGNHNCDHNEDVGVRCGNIGGGNE